MRAAFLLLAVGLAAPVRAQVNYIANGDLETFANSTCPPANVCLTGSTPAGGWSIERGTPEHLCSYTGGQFGAEMPHLYRADIAHSGNGYALLLGTAANTPDAFRFTTGSFLQVGVNYTFSFWAKAPKHFEGGTLLMKGASGTIYGAQTVTGVNTWTGYSHTFTPSVEEPYFILTTTDGNAGVALDDLALAPTSPLSLHIRRFDGFVRGSNAVLEWEMTEEHGLESFSVERSLDGRGFQRIGNYTATAGFTTHYLFTDTTIPAGMRVLYRLRVLDISGVSRYSRTIEIQRPADAPRTFSLVPNPVRNMLRITGFKEPGSVRIFSSDGRLMWMNDGVTEEQTFDVSGLAAGVYFLECRSSSGTAIERFLKE